MKMQLKMDNVSWKDAVVVRILPLVMAPQWERNHFDLCEKPQVLSQSVMSLVPSFHGESDKTVGFGLFFKQQDGSYKLSSIEPDWYVATGIAQRLALTIEPEPWVTGDIETYPHLRIIRACIMGASSMFTVKYYSDPQSSGEVRLVDRQETKAVEMANFIASQFDCKIAPAKPPTIYPMRGTLAHQAV